MTLTLPDDPCLAEFTPEMLRLDLACGLYASGEISRSVAARIAGVDRGIFDQALVQRHIPSYTVEMLEEDSLVRPELFRR
ncbi:MAG: hypothetical protein HC904_15830 [Blastochloris sp.]|nr:hypothetical protein [Blastochloris sp.]